MEGEAALAVRMLAGFLLAVGDGMLVLQTVFYSQADRTVATAAGDEESHAHAAIDGRAEALHVEPVDEAGLRAAANLIQMGSHSPDGAPIGCLADQAALAIWFYAE